uniref:Tc toxin subunit A n=1 Tax=Breoghania sp. TaxID=2065378 RepID=UPI002604124C
GGQVYARPSSLQSTQSVPAYLRHLYRIATGADSDIGIIQPKDEPFGIESRRPDLVALVLSEDNLK